jgi:hypothetical protein
VLGEDEDAEGDLDYGTDADASGGGGGGFDEGGGGGGGRGGGGGGYLDYSGRTFSNLSSRDVEELQRVRVAVLEDIEDDDAALSDFDSDISDSGEGEGGGDALTMTAMATGGAEGVVASRSRSATMAGSMGDAPARVGGVTLEDIDDIKKSAYELENEFKFDFADNVMPSFVEKKVKDDAVFEKLMKQSEEAGGGGGGGSSGGGSVSGPISTPYRRKCVHNFITIIVISALCSCVVCRM